MVSHSRDVLQLNAGTLVLPYIALFHHFNARSGGRLKPGEQRELALLRDLFEPRRVTSAGFRRNPITFRVLRRGRLCLRTKEVPCRVCSISLREVIIEVDSELPPGAKVSLKIEGARGDQWWRFQGIVTRRTSTNKLILRLQGASLKAIYREQVGC